MMRTEKAELLSSLGERGRKLGPYRRFRLSRIFLAPLLFTIFAVFGNTVAHANLISTAQVSFTAGGFGAGGCVGPPVNVPSPLASSSCSTSRTLGGTNFSGSALATAQYGGLGIQNVAALNPGEPATAVTSVTEAELTDILTFRGAGIASLAIIGEASGGTSVIPGGATLDFNDIFQINLGGALPTMCSVILPEVSDVPTRCTTPVVPISDGSSVGLTMLLEGSVGASFHGLSGTGSGSITSDYSHTAKVVGIEVFDADGNLLNNVTVTSASGFAYPLGVPPAAIPEPSSLLLLASGFAGLAGVTWRRTRK